MDKREKRHKRLIKIVVGLTCLFIFLVYTVALDVYILMGLLDINGIVVPYYLDLLKLGGIDFLFWLVGILLLYFNSSQLGIKTRLVGILVGLIPIANMIALGIIMSTCFYEATLELGKERLNVSRKDDKICQTKYPLLMVHGVFFRDYRYFNYWGRIPEELEFNGATIFYGNQNSASSVKDNGEQLARRIKDIAINQGYGKVNIIAHSKGGLDSRAAISLHDCEDYVASLTTISTPHRGCEFADYLLSKISPSVQESVATVYNHTLTEFGDENPDFLKAVYDLTASNCAKFNETVLDSPKVYYQSFGSTMKKASGGTFPLNYTTYLVKYFDGSNDGLVGEKSFAWGKDYELLYPAKSKGISHGDIIDLNRTNIRGFDVREFYVQLVAKLKSKGY